MTAFDKGCWILLKNVNSGNTSSSSNLIIIPADAKASIKVSGKTLLVKASFGN